MIYVTGDRHRNFKDLVSFCEDNNTTKADILVILGDAGINFLGGEFDVYVKEQLEKLPISLLCVHGNHENRPTNIPSYKEVPFLGGIAYREDQYPSLLFAKDGEVYIFEENGKKAIIIGGAYSVDKPYRLKRNLAWWYDEQPSAEIKTYVEDKLRELDYKVDYVFTHTCPIKYTPTEVMLRGINQSTVDKSTEEWLDKLESQLTYDLWYCGHWHTNKAVDKMRFLYNNIVKLGE
mgnify:CR=1 FL=1